MKISFAWAAFLTVGLLTVSGARAELGQGNGSTLFQPEGVATLDTSARRVDVTPTTSYGTSAPAPGAAVGLGQVQVLVMDSSGRPVTVVDGNAQVYILARARVQSQNVPQALTFEIRTRAGSQQVAGRLDNRYLYRGEALYVARANLRASSRTPGVSIFRTTSSRDALTFREGIQGMNSLREISFVEDMSQVGSAVTEPRMAQFYAGMSGKQVFESGGVDPTLVIARDGSGQVLGVGRVAAPGYAQGMYFSGHYPYTSGGFLNGEQITPDTIEGRSWGQHLKTLVFATCYAVDINAPGEEIVRHGRGVHGAKWWKKFQGTLLGYRALAPSNPTDSEVARRFLRRLRSQGVSFVAQGAESRKVAEAWMHVNMHELGATGAAAVDAQGRYYYLRSREVNLRGVPVRGSYRWAVADRNIWEPQNDRMQQEYAFERSVFSPIETIQWEEFGGRPPTLSQVLSNPRYQQAAAQMGRSPQDPQLVAKVREFLAYEEHIFYDVPRPDYTQRAVYWMVQRSQGRFVRTEDVIRHFTPAGSRPGAQMFPRNVIEEMTFRGNAWLAIRTQGTGDVNALAQRLSQVHQITPERQAYIQYLIRYASQS